MPLFSSVRIGSLALPNRIVMAPLTRRRASAGKIPNELNALHYAQRASAGLIITESVEVDPRSGGNAPTRPGIFNESQAEGWRKVTEAIHAHGGRVYIQLSHLGRASHPLMLVDDQEPVGPSPIAAEGMAFTPQGPKPFPVPHALEEKEIPAIVAQFAHAARLAKAANFDGVEIHGANGYLIDEFLRDGSNRRTDNYGGSLENRARFLLEVTEAVIAIWGSDRVGVRLSPLNTFNGMSDSNPREIFAYAAQALNRMNLAYLHLVEPAPAEAEKTAPEITGLIREAFKGPLILAGGYTKERAEQAVASGIADLIAFGEAYIANPDLPERFRTGAALNAPDRSTFYGGDSKGYTDYPALEAAMSETA